ncbi:type VII secretion target [Nocardia asteroides]|uniref:Uncharacterized protein n=1 Tax=Nocardia asteroides NBRC 15531 TaxID=1110697 RepID=U5E4B1_NOCAS|nr:type VII secretion target [Nocardia asteroides]UGT49378.1 hypothetical protein LT345_01785 [Nocardia asteroides]GAD83972.1 hypothetical protein NCAST_20_05420 [Nocardia asteroides NBRC 15531]SFL88371.1 Excreted virulence factor EspC, type VII ESX diderm [Nocardia asteroides]VEG38144.1 Uncharacterised protein [Nocardia asteroides]
MLQVDIDELRRLATTVTSVGAEIDKIDVRTNGDKVGEAFPGVEIGAACAKAGEYSEGAWLRIAERMQKLAAIVNQCADNVQTTDQQFKNRLEEMDFFATGSVG